MNAVRALLIKTTEMLAFFCSSFLPLQKARLHTVPVCSNHDGIVGPKLPLRVAFECTSRRPDLKLR